MSTTIDQRVVEMRFDNKNFENNVSHTMSTLEKLKQKLNLTGASKGLEEVDSAAKRVNMSGLGAGVEAVSAKFSALQVMGITALTNITNQAVNAGKRIASALTIDPIKTGFSEYETQINAVQTILANTESKGTTLKDVNSALDTLNTYADKTIYNFTEMTRNIGTFTAAGVDLDTSVSSIQGIANLAAVSGSTSQQASTAMYQLSQALAAGKVSLMDWNSVVNAGMGGQVFQDALKRTAKVMGKDVDGMIKKYGSFRESLTQGEWLTTEVLTKTLEQFTMAAEEGSDEWNKFKKSLMDEGYTEQQATEILKMANTATNAATKVKTFTQLWDTLKEAAQSGWTQTWEIIVGDFEEAKSLLTNVSDVIGEMINNSSKARNELLSGWKDAGGRNDLIEGISNAFEGIMNIVKPIKEAFRDIFPPLTVKQLTNFTAGFKDLTAKFKEFTEAHGDQIKTTFKGIFSVLDIGVTFVKELASGAGRLVKSFSGLGNNILDSTSSIGEWLTNLRDSVKEGDLFGRAIDKIADAVSKGISKLKEFGSAIKDSFKAPGYDGFFGFLKATWEFVTKIGSGIAKAFGSIGQTIANVFGDNTFGDVIDSGVFAALMVAIYKFIDNLNSPLSALSDVFEGLTGEDGILGNVTGILDEVRGCFKAYQDQLKANTLLKIAGAIGILAASIFVISTIDPATLGNSLSAITILFGELLASLAIFTSISGNLKGVMRAVPLMISLSASLLILSLALKIIGSMKPDEMFTGLIGVAGGMGVLIGAVNLLPEKKVNNAAKAIRTLSTSMLILSAALKIMATMSWDELLRGLAGAAGGLAALVIAVRLLPKDAGLRSIGMIGLATALVILGAALKLMATMSWDEIGRGLASLAGSMIAIGVAMRIMPKNMVTMGLGLIGVATALIIVGAALKIMASMSWGEIGKGLVVLGGALLELAIGLNLMRGAIPGAAALLIASAALAIITPVLVTLGGLSWSSIVKGLVTLAGAFAIIGVAGALLGPIVPTLLGLAGAFALFGIATLGIGAGLVLLGAGVTALATALSAGATAIVASISVIILGILDLIPNMVVKFGDIILAFCKVIGDCAPQIAETVLKLVSEVLKSLVTYIPQIADSLFELLIGILDVVAARLPELVTAAVKVIGAFFQGVVDALSGLDTTSLLQGVLAVGLLSGLMFALSAVAGLVPGAMAGVLGIGVVIAELTLVLAAIGALAQIPGLSWIVEEGGNFLQTLGTAIGQFIGGIAGGVAQGFSASLPQIGSDLSGFMTNLQPFIEGAKTIDASVMEGVKTLVGVLLAITGANIIDSLTSWITGGSSLTQFGADIAAFAPYMKQYSDTIKGIDASTIEASANAAKALSELANSLPNSGGLAGFFAGENDISTFGQQLIPFGLGLKGYAMAVAGIDAQAIVASAAAAKAIAEMTNYIPNSGGVVAWFTGENSIAKFGTDLITLGMGLRGYSIAITGINIEAITASASAAKALADMTSFIPNSGGIVAWLTGENSITRFASDLPVLGMGLKGFSDSIVGIVPENITAAATAAKALADLTNVIPSEGGIKAWFSGETSVSKFANDMIVLGMGLKGFSLAVMGIVPENITAAANAAKALAQMCSTIPSEGGVKAWFTGESSVSKFASELPKLGTGLKGFSEKISGIVPENITAAANAAKSLAQMVNVIPSEGGIKAWFTGETSVSKFAEHLPSLGAGLKGFSDKIAGIVPENITSAANAAKTLAQMADTTPKNTDKLIEFGTNLVTFGGKLKSYFEATSGITVESTESTTHVINSVKNAASINSEGIKNAASAIGKLVEALKKMPSITENTVAGFSKAMDTLGKTSVDKLVTSFNNAAPKLTTSGNKLVTALTDGIKAKESMLNNIVKSMINSAINVINSQAAAFKTAGVRLISAFVGGIQSSAAHTATAMRTAIASALGATNGYYSSFHSAGQYLADGFAGGISANSYKAAAQAAAMATAAKNAAEKALGIKSPSRVFYGIGEYTGEGFINALIAYGSKVYNAGSEMADNARSGLTDAIGKVKDILNGDADMQPTIRPILDLSNVQAGAGAINGIFGSSVGLSANIGAISSAMNRNQNGGNDDVISAIDKLRDSMSNLGNTTYNIDGVNLGNDAAVVAAFETIVRAAQMERRS